MQELAKFLLMKSLQRYKHRVSRGFNSLDGDLGSLRGKPLLSRCPYLCSDFVKRLLTLIRDGYGYPRGLPPNYTLAV